MTQFHEGQEVEVVQPVNHPVEGYPGHYWRKAKIVETPLEEQEDDVGFLVQFPDDTRGVFDAAHIKAITKIIEVPGTCRQQHDEYQE